MEDTTSKRSSSEHGKTLDDGDEASESYDDSSRDNSEQDAEDGSDQEVENEDIEEASNEKEDDKEPTGEDTDMVAAEQPILEPLEPVSIHITPHTPEWHEEESDGEAAQSGDEKSPPKLNLKDIVPTPSVVTNSSNTAFSSLSHNTDPSLIIDPNSGQHLITVEIQLQPNKEHLEVLLEETRCLLDYVQEVDSTARFVSKD